MIRRKRIRSLNPYKNQLPTTDKVFVAFNGVTEAQLKRAGFPVEAKPGDTVLPRAVGRITAYNANGKRIVRRDKPMETAYRTVEWHWTEWHGRDKVEQSKFVDVPYKRYPRDDVPPPALEITLVKDANGNYSVISQEIDGWKSDEQLLVHAINLFLELFGECVVLDKQRTEVLPATIHRVNWKFLPKGEYPFSRVREELKPVLNRIKRGNRTFVNKRLERLNSFDPAFTVVGLSGFSGYILMAYPDRDLYVLESLLYGNATYILEKDWESVSKLTKAEVLNSKLHKDRIIHHSNWFAKVKNLFQD